MKWSFFYRRTDGDTSGGGGCRLFGLRWRKRWPRNCERSRWRFWDSKRKGRKSSTRLTWMGSRYLGRYFDWIGKRRADEWEAEFRHGDGARYKALLWFSKDGDMGLTRGLRLLSGVAKLRIGVSYIGEIQHFFGIKVLHRPSPICWISMYTICSLPLTTYYFRVIAGE